MITLDLFIIRLATTTDASHQQHDYLSFKILKINLYKFPLSWNTLNESLH